MPDSKYSFISSTYGLINKQMIMGSCVALAQKNKVSTFSVHYCGWKESWRIHMYQSITSWGKRGDGPPNLGAGQGDRNSWSFYGVDIVEQVNEVYDGLIFFGSLAGGINLAIIRLLKLSLIMLTTHGLSFRFWSSA
ncbi:hypothetical protein [Marinobacter nauticus]|uniref:hypothetical protein n=1 Tax=Marinobacter nauticus TaxID=2743 RepID=UPI001CFD912A|nr:hypothetical protein [Marinobacter nauticus]